ncbi:MAG: DNA methyltransferase [Casimicrobium sp.]
MRTLPANSVDSVVTDPPYGIGFMGKAWDRADINARVREERATKSTTSEMQAFQLFSEMWAAEALRVLKPGGYLLCFAAARSYHRMASGVEDAGFEVRDQLMWLYGSGFPKSHNIGKAMGASAGAEAAFERDASKQWEGWGTALKPAHEPILLARRPFNGTVVENVLKHGTGGMNIAACRVEHGERLRTGAGKTFHAMHEHEGRVGEPSAKEKYANSGCTNFAMSPGPRGGDIDGRWPANVLHDGSEAVVALFPDAPGQMAAVTGKEPTATGFSGTVGYSGMRSRIASAQPRLDIGSAARFFYCAKASRADRNEGLVCGATKAVGANATMRDVESADWAKRNGNHHPTVKPTQLMRYLLRLVTPPGGVTLDPFMGSGSTGKAALLEQFRFIGIEDKPDYYEIAQQRIEHVKRSGVQVGLFGGGRSI